MYGLVNDALRRFVVAHHGEAFWSELATRVDAPESFDVYEQFPDEMTGHLVAAYCDRTGGAPDAALEAFGRYWISEVAVRQFPAYLALAGTTLPEVLSNLDSMHGRIATEFHNIDQPSFKVEEQGPGAMTVRYYSVREGMAPFVIGLIKGLSDHLEQDAEVRLAAHSGDDEARAVLEVRVQ